MKKLSFKIAFGGIISALCVVLECAVGVLPIFLYVFPMLCGLLMMILIDECGVKTAVSAFASISVLSLLLCSDKEAAILYVGFFGYYPIVRTYLQKIKSRVLRIVLKLLMFNAAMVCSYLILIAVFGLEQLGLEGGAYVLLGLLAMLNVMFGAFDFILDKLVVLYRTKFRDRFFGGRR